MTYKEFVQEWLDDWRTKRGEKAMTEDDIAYEFAEEAVTGFPFTDEHFLDTNNKEIDDFYKAMIPLVKKLIPEYEPSLGM